MKLIRQFWPHIQVGAALGFVAFLFACEQHDNGIPQNPTPAQQARAAEISKEYIRILVSRIAAFDQFCDMSGDEVAGTNAVVESFESSLQLWKQNKDDVCRFVDYQGVESDRARLAELIEQVEEASERMATEVWRRRDDPDFEIDQTLYSQTSKLISREFPEPTYENFCNSSTCFWCKWKHYFHFDR